MFAAASARVMGSAGKAIVPALMLGGAYYGYSQKIGKGWAPLPAAAAEAVNQAIPFLVNPALYVGVAVGLPLVRATGAAVTSAVQNQNNHVRLSRTPFSHRFEHNAYTAGFQAAGLAALGGSSSGMGMEASRFAQRYGRRD